MCDVSIVAVHRVDIKDIRTKQLIANGPRCENVKRMPDECQNPLLLWDCHITYFLDLPELFDCYKVLGRCEA